MQRYTLAAVIGTLALTSPLSAQPRAIDLEITHTCDATFPIISVPLSLSKEDAAKRELLVEVLGGINVSPKPKRLGQLTEPGLLTEHIKPAAAGQVRRDLHTELFGTFKAGAVTKVKVHLDEPSKFVGFGFDWKYKNEKENAFADLSISASVPCCVMCTLPTTNRPRNCGTRRTRFSITSCHGQRRLQGRQAALRHQRRRHQRPIAEEPEGQSLSPPSRPHVRLQQDHL